MIAVCRGAALALGILVLAATGAGAEERILRFVSDAVVQGNGDLEVTETIRVRAEGHDIRRGILRDFPTSYTRQDGARVEVGFHVVSVARDGRAEPYATERMANGVRVRIGHADTLLRTGQHEYVIRYRTTRQIGFFADFDELYWNATGTGWTFAIDEVEARIRLPDAVPFRKAAFYTGPQGSRGSDATVVVQEPGRIVFRTTRRLPPNHGLTVAASWDKGVVTPPTTMQQATWLLQDNVPLAIAGAGLVLLFGFYGFAWLRVGRDPPRGTIIPLFGPPEGLSAAAVRYVNRMAFDDRCFSVAIIELGVNGHLRLVQDDDGMRIRKQKDGRAIAPPEQGVKTELFRTGSPLLLSNQNHETFGKAKIALRDGLVAAYTRRLFTSNFAWSGVGFVAAAIFILTIAIAIHVSQGGGDRTSQLIAGMLLPLAPILIGAALVRTGWRLGESGRSYTIAGFVVGAVSVAGGLAMMFARARGFVEVLPGVAAYMAAPLAMLGFGWLKAPSRQGRAVMDQIEGFRQYLGVAEEDRLEFLHPPEKTPELFERFLPYAVALDVENTWAARFAGVLAAAGAGAAAASAWYSGDRDITSDPVAFADHLGGSLSQTIASSSTAPGSSSGSGSDSSSSSSDSGSSGGGGGGGGGSGW
jgi:uncharacterized membrane protein YgcG